jgi:c-di-GMP-binding flagellar brake protein YcgR
MMTQLEVALSLSGAARAQKVRMKGVLVRKEKDPATGRFSIAIFFSDIQPADRKKLEKFIERRLSPD